MRYLFEATLLAYFVAALANSSVKSTKNAETGKGHGDVNNNYYSFYAGPNCKKIEQQLVEMRNEILEEIRTLKKNETAGKGLTKALSFFKFFERLNTPLCFNN